MPSCVSKILTGIEIKREDFSVAFSLSDVSEIENLWRERRSSQKYIGCFAVMAPVALCVVLHGLG